MHHPFIIFLHFCFNLLSQPWLERRKVSVETVPVRDRWSVLFQFCLQPGKRPGPKQASVWDKPSEP